MWMTLTITFAALLMPRTAVALAIAAMFALGLPATVALLTVAVHGSTLGGW